MSKSQKLRELIKEKDIVRVAGAHDGLTAKLVEEAGFDAVWASGFEISASYGVPDAGILTMKEFLEAAITMNDATTIPVIADCDTGFGNSNNVIHMVRKYESADIAAVTIEDKKFPKRNSLLPGGRQELASVGEFVGKIMAAKNARRTKEFMVIARIEALIAGWGLEEALRRADAYVNAGADAILIHSKSKTPNEIIAFLKTWDKKAPIVVVPTTYCTITVEDLKRLGVDIVIYANHGLRASVKAIREIFQDILKDGTTKNVESKITPLSDIFILQGMPKLQEDERKFVKTDMSDIVTVIPAAGSHLEAQSMRDILEDRPLAMIDINGKPLLARNIETLRSLGISDIIVVGGYKAEEINADELGVELVVNEDYEETYILDSIMEGLYRVKPGKEALIVYSDIYFEREIISRLLSRRGDIVIVVGPVRTGKIGYKSLDLVVTENPPIEGERFLHLNRRNRLLRIGTGLSPEEAKLEFIGITYLLPKAVNLFKKVYEEVKDKYKGEPFHEAPSVEKASFTDMLQELIDRGVEIDVMEVFSGWMEIYSFGDYRNICALLS